MQVVLATSCGDIEVELFLDQAPRSAGSFLKFLDTGRLNDGGFNRVVRPDNDNAEPAITVIQGGVLDLSCVRRRDLVTHETTEQSGIKHTDGVLSLARGAPGTGCGGVFFICIGDQPCLDFGGQRNKDGQGFAAFGRVVSGMDVVKAINALTGTLTGADSYMNNQMLAEPVVISRAYRR